MPVSGRGSEQGGMDSSQDFRDLVEHRIDVTEYLRRIELRLLERDRDNCVHRAHRRGFWAGFRSAWTGRKWNAG